MKEFTEIIEFLKAEILKIDANAELCFDSLTDVEDSIEQYFIANNDISSQTKKYYFIADKIVMIYYTVDYIGDNEVFCIHKVSFVSNDEILREIRMRIMICEDDIRFAKRNITELKAMAYDIQNTQ